MASQNELFLYYFPCHFTHIVLKNHLYLTVSWQPVALGIVILFCLNIFLKWRRCQNISEKKNHWNVNDKLHLYWCISIPIRSTKEKNILPWSVNSMLMAFNIVGILVLEKDQILTDFFSSLILVSDSSEGNTMSRIPYMYRKRTLVLPIGIRW